MILSTILKRVGLALALAGALLLGGCGEDERREIRAQQERIAAVDARESRLAQEYATRLAAETQRKANELAAQTQRIANELATETRRLAQLAIEETKRQRAKLIGNVAETLGFVGLVAAALGGAIGWIILCMRRLGERHMAERTKRHEISLKAIETDPHLSPDHRKELYHVAVETSGKPQPLIGYAPGGAS